MRYRCYRDSLGIVSAAVVQPPLEICRYRQCWRRVVVGESTAGGREGTSYGQSLARFRPARGHWRTTHFLDRGDRRDNCGIRIWPIGV